MLGAEQLEWLEGDLKGKSASTPIVIFSHIPLWISRPEWGSGTGDRRRRLGYLSRFGSVTVLNGHIHQLMQKVEGNVTFHTARSTAFPQPAPGTSPVPGPKLVPAGELRKWLGVRDVVYSPTPTNLAVTNSDLVCDSNEPVSISRTALPRCLSRDRRPPAAPVAGEGPSDAAPHESER